MSTSENRSPEQRDSFLDDMDERSGEGVWPDAVSTMLDSTIARPTTC
jgi:hypothetical protein